MDDTVRVNNTLNPESCATPPALVSGVSAISAGAVSREFDRLAVALQRRFADALQAVLLYGSCLRRNNPCHGVVDLFAVVDDYRQAYARPFLRRLNAWLPPNVFYMEVPGSPSTLRAKYAVISLADFETGICGWIHPYVWARFAQPVRLLYSSTDGVAGRLNTALAGAVLRFLRETVSTLPAQTLRGSALWMEGFRLTYAAELRPEREHQAQELVRGCETEYERLISLAQPALRSQLEVLKDGCYRIVDDPDLRRRMLQRWRLRRWQGRVLSILRLAKAAFTFSGSIDYAAWKIERHTGVRIEITPRLRRYPLLYGWGVLWKLLRRGALH